MKKSLNHPPSQGAEKAAANAHQDTAATPHEFLNFNFKNFTTHSIITMIVLAMFICSMVGCSAPADSDPWAAMSAEAAQIKADEAELNEAADKIAEAAYGIGAEQPDQPEQKDKPIGLLPLAEGFTLADESVTAPTPGGLELYREWSNTYMPQTKTTEDDARYAFFADKTEFFRFEPELPEFWYLSLPLNLYAQSADQYISNADLVAQIGEAEAERLAGTAIVSASSILDYGYDPEILHDQSNDIYTRDMTQRLRGLLEDAHLYYENKGAKFMQTSSNTSAASLVYRDGDGHIRVRCMVETRVDDADDNAMRDTGYTSEDIGVWYQRLCDVVLYHDLSGQLDGVVVIPITEGYKVTDTTRLKILG